MASQLTLTPILARTKGEVRRLRLAGSIPVSLQHRGVPTLHFQQETRPLEEFIQQYGKSTLLNLWITPDNRQVRAIVHDVQRDPLTQRLKQVTFQLVGIDDTVKTSVRLIFQGEPADVRNSEAMVQHQMDRLEIECAPGDLPDHILVNVAALSLGDVLRVSSLEDNPRYKIMTPANTVLASLTSTRAGIAAGETTESVPEPAS